LVELLVATVVSTLVLGGAVALTSTVQNGYRKRVEGAAAEQEGRYALEWIGKHIRMAGNNFPPVGVGKLNTCPAADAGTPVEAVRWDPDGNGKDDDIRLETDSSPADGRVGGDGILCDQKDEDVTISFDEATHTIKLLDNNAPPANSTDAVIEKLEFFYLDSDRVKRDYRTDVTFTPDKVYYVETQITVRGRTATAEGLTPQVLSSVVRVRSR
jgi:hypothetical protein